MIGTFKFDNAGLELDFKNGKYKIWLDVNTVSTSAVKQMINELTENETYTATIDFIKKKRTLDQNAYLWVLCDRIAQKIRSTKEEVYKHYVKEVGVFDTICLLERAKDTFVKRWSSKGLGWLTEETDSKLEGCVNLLCYCGSSVYDKSEMQRLLDEVIHACEELYIPTQVNGYEEMAK